MRKHPSLSGKHKWLALTLHQPYAVAMLLRLKGYETRSWSTAHRGPLFIHAANADCRKLYPEQYAAIDRDFPGQELHYGAIIAVGNLVDCIKMKEIEIPHVSELERFWGIWQPGRYAWRVEDVDPLPDPIFCKGQQGLWVPDITLLKP